MGGRGGRRRPPSGAVTQTLATRRAETHPADTIPYYLRYVEDALRGANRNGYRTAARWLVDLRGLHARVGIEAQFAAYLTGLSETHRRRRAFLDELRRRRPMGGVTSWSSESTTSWTGSRLRRPWKRAAVGRVISSRRLADSRIADHRTPSCGPLQYLASQASTHEPHSGRACLRTLGSRPRRCRVHTAS